MKKYKIARVSLNIVKPIIHKSGLPLELSSGEDTQKLFPFPKILIIQFDENRAFLYRFIDEETPCGDTWHANLQDALFQASREYENSVGDWHDVPENRSNDITEVISYAFQHLMR